MVLCLLCCQLPVKSICYEYSVLTCVLAFRRPLIRPMATVIYEFYLVILVSFSKPIIRERYMLFMSFVGPLLVVLSTAC